MVAFLLASAMVVQRGGPDFFDARSTLARAGKTRWRAFAVTIRDGDGPPNTRFSIATRQDGLAYSVSVRDEEIEPFLRFSRTYNEPIRFRKLEVYTNPCNDFWEEKGQGHKVFPRGLYVGYGTLRNRPVTLVWILTGYSSRQPIEIWRGYRVDARWLDGLVHGETKPNGVMTEFAQASWVGIKGGGTVTRTLRLEDDHFVAGPWNKKGPAP